MSCAKQSAHKNNIYFTPDSSLHNAVSVAEERAPYCSFDALRSSAAKTTIYE